MSEWWTYRVSDFLMFAPRTYYRLFELYNAEVWPAHLMVMGLAGAVLIVSVRAPAWMATAVCAALAAGWIWVAWAFLLQRLATINWAASGFAAAFAIEGGLLALAALVASRVRRPRAGFDASFDDPFGASSRDASDRVPVPIRTRAIAGALLTIALIVHPAIAVLSGRRWQQAEVVGLAPDPTALATLGLLLLIRPPMPGTAQALWKLLWPIPVLWCLITGATLWTMGAPDAWLMPAAALLAMAAASRPAH